MLSVDSHYLNDPLPKNCSSSGRGANTGREAAMWSELAGAFEHRFKNMA
jgi:hypothetical protein